MNDLISYLENLNDDELIENTKKFLCEKRRLKTKHSFFQKLSAAVSDKIMGPPANKCMNAKEKASYDSIMDEVMEDGVWDNQTALSQKLNKHGLALR